MAITSEKVTKLGGGGGVESLTYDSPGDESIPLPKGWRVAFAITVEEYGLIDDYTNYIYTYTPGPVLMFRVK